LNLGDLPQEKPAMKRLIQFLVLWMGCLRVLGADPDADVASLKTHLDPKTSTFSAYRFHGDDSLLFQKGLRLTCRWGEESNGKEFGNPPETRYTSYSWVYQW
jgi:hypothetical protein